MRRLSWGTVAALSVAFAAGIAAAFAMSLREAARDRPELTSPVYAEDVPLDFADARVRRAFDEYRQLASRGEASIAETCESGSGEIYRVEVIAAMTTHPDFALVDVAVGGGRARVDVKEFNRGGWHPVSRRDVSDHEIEIVRERAARLLTARIPTVGDQPIDSAEWTVQMCRRGRYHFFQRYGPRWDAPADAPFIAFTDVVMAIRHATDPGS